MELIRYYGEINYEVKPGIIKLCDTGEDLSAITNLSSQNEYINRLAIANDLRFSFGCMSQFVCYNRNANGHMAT